MLDPFFPTWGLVLRSAAKSEEKTGLELVYCIFEVVILNIVFHPRAKKSFQMSHIKFIFWLSKIQFIEQKYFWKKFITFSCPLVSSQEVSFVFKLI